MISQDEAVSLINDFAAIQCELMKEENSRRGCTKRSLKRERQIATALFIQLTGQMPTDQQLSDMEVK